jgi:hypothetical protein
MDTGTKIFGRVRHLFRFVLVSTLLLSCTSGKSSPSGLSANGAGGGSPASSTLSETFVDGNGLTGLNRYPSQAANTPQGTLFTSKFYVTWAENATISSTSQIRVAVYNGNDSAPSWTFVDGGGDGGINDDITQNGTRPQLAVFGPDLYAIWQESTGSAEQIRVKVYNGNDSAPLWTSVDGSGINFDSAQIADLPHLTVSNSKLYASWEEFNGKSLQVRVKVYTGGNNWSSVDGKGIYGGSPQLLSNASGSKLYLSWQEFKGTATQIRWSVYNGNDSHPSWLNVDGAFKIPSGANSCTTTGSCLSFSNGGINGPAGVATDGSNNAWIANLSNNSVTKIVPSALADCSVGCSTYFNGGIYAPTAISNYSGNIWVANSGNNSVTKILSTAALDCSSGCTNYTGASLSNPVALSSDSSGNVWVVNAGNNSVTKISNTAAPDCSSGCANYTGGGLNSPVAVAIDAAGNVWVANFGNSSITEILNGAPLDCFNNCLSFTGGGIGGPSGISIDSSGNLWVSNKTRYTVTKIPISAVDCSNCQEYSGGGISGPTGILVDGTSNIWVANNNNTITRIASGSSTDCTLGCTQYEGGGSRQTGIALDSTGAIWVTTQGNIETTGLNKNSLKNATDPRLLFYNSKLYAAWKESNDVASQIRIAVYNGNDVAPLWSFVDGGNITGLNHDSSRNAYHPQFTASGADLYLVWQEFNGAATEIRLAKYNGIDSAPVWTFVDGDGLNGLNYEPGKGAIDPQLTVFNSKLYLTWSEYNVINQIRAAVVQ